MKERINMRVKMFTDGAARGNPDGPGGYGVVLQYTDTKGNLHEKELSEGYEKTTNNRMELMGVIAGLEALNRPCEVDVFSDSQYVKSATKTAFTSARELPTLPKQLPHLLPPQVSSVVAAAAAIILLLLILFFTGMLILIRKFRSRTR